MPQLIEVAFKGNRKEFFLWEADEAPPLRTPVIVDADRGEDLGLVHTAGELAAQRSAHRRRTSRSDSQPTRTSAAWAKCAARTTTLAAARWSA